MALVYDLVRKSPGTGALGHQSNQNKKMDRTLPTIAFSIKAEHLLCPLSTAQLLEKQPDDLLAKSGVVALSLLP